MSRKDRKFNRFFRPKSSDLQKKKKKKKKGLRQNSRRFFFQNFASSNVSGGALFAWGGGYFQFFTENQPQKHKKHAILHTSQANGGGSSPPRPPPGYATEYKYPSSDNYSTVITECYTLTQHCCNIANTFESYVYTFTVMKKARLLLFCCYDKSTLSVQCITQSTTLYQATF